ncbi:hypothetical protein N7490_000021 [Penicillium lividum]|nr:hypothetical protein N7490_000021 [Penicillium lividum]
MQSTPATSARIALCRQPSSHPRFDGFLPRDIRPANVLLNQNMQIIGGSLEFTYAAQNLLDFLIDL